MAVLIIGDLGRSSRAQSLNAGQAHASDRRPPTRSDKASPARRVAREAAPEAAREAARLVHDQTRCLARINSLNVTLLRRIQSAILEVPQQFHMGCWHQGDILPGALDKCSATACIAGWALVLDLRVRLSEVSGLVSGLDVATFPRFSIEESAIGRYACSLLGLSLDQGEKLFFVQKWPTRFSGQYLECPPYCGELKRDDTY